MAATNIVALQSEVEAVKDVLKDDVSKVLERQGKLGALDQRADQLQVDAAQFQKKTKQLETKMLHQNQKLKVIIGVSVALTIVLIIVVILVYTL